MRDVTKNKVIAVLDSLFDGVSLKKALKTHSCGVETFYKALEKYPEYQIRYAYAEKYSADNLADELIEISDTQSDPIKARNMIDVRKWIASKRAPKKYGDRIDLNVEGSIDLNAAIADASRRILLPNSYLNVTPITQDIETIGITHDEHTCLEHVVDDDSGEDMFK